VSDVDKKDKFLSINNKESLPTSSLASHQKMASNVTEFNVSAMTVKVKQEINLTSNNTNNNSKEDYDLIKLNIASSFKADGDDYTSILLKFLQSKFLPTKSQIGKKNFFNQQIQIQPPEGINAVVASPLVESSKGWAPSIPPMQINKAKTNLGDLMMRAKGGIQAGDIPKEAHMAFYLGIMNEEEKRYEESLKFYKKYFLSTKLLQDIYGMELALNRIGVLYSNIGDFNQSLYYHDKHRNITTHNIKGFVAHYNSGICQRVLGRVDEAIKSFNSALGMAEEENVLFIVILRI
jgi:tetratricopeptide (TPR) repeat protein